METHPILNMDCIFDILVAKLLMIFDSLVHHNYEYKESLPKSCHLRVHQGFIQASWLQNKMVFTSPSPKTNSPNLSTFSKYSTNQMIWLVTRKSSPIGWKLSVAKSMDRVFRDSCFTRMCQSFIPPRKCREDHITDQSKILRVTEDWIKTHFCTE